MDNEKLKIYLGLKIKNFRNKLGLTQEQLGEKINRTQRQVSLIEIGQSFPNPTTLANIANVFKCTMKDLFDFESIENIENLKDKLEVLISELPEDKLKILYVIGKNI